MSGNSITTAFQKKRLIAKTSKNDTGPPTNMFKVLQIGGDDLPKHNNILPSNSPAASSPNWRVNFTNVGNITNEQNTASKSKWTTITSKKQEPRMKTTEPDLSPSSTRSTAKWLASNNWRKRDPGQDKAREDNARTVRSKNSQYQGRVKPAPGPRTIGGVPYAEQVEGTIVWHWDIRPCSKSTVAKQGEHIVTDAAGCRSLKKGRYWIILKKSGEIITEAPIYTNGNTGLKSIPSNKWKDYYSICPKHVHPSKFTNLSPTNDVLEIEWMRDVGKQVEGTLERETMVVHWKETHTRNINIRDLRIVGVLSNKSRDIICNKSAGSNR